MPTDLWRSFGELLVVLGGTLLTTLTSEAITFGAKGGGLECEMDKEGL